MLIIRHLCLTAFVVFSLVSVSGCSKVSVKGNDGIPAETYMGVKPVFSDGSSVGNLTQSYLKNTESLTIVNGRLQVLCEAYQIGNCGPK